MYVGPLSKEVGTQMYWSPEMVSINNMSSNYIKMMLSCDCILPIEQEHLSQYDEDIWHFKLLLSTLPVMQYRH